MDTSVQFSTSITGIINSIPLSSRAVYETAIRLVEDKAEKSATANDQAMNIDAYNTQGLHLNALNSIKTPVFQLSKEFLSDGSAKDLEEYRNIEQKVVELRHNLMSDLSMTKWKEVLYYKNKYLNSTNLQLLAKDVWDKALRDYMTGRSVSDYNELPAAVKKEFQSLKDLGTQPFDYVIGLVNTKHASLKAKRKEKGVVKQKDEIEMTATGQSSKDYEKSMEKMVESYLQKKKQSMKDKARSSKVCLPDYLLPHTDLFPAKKSTEQKEKAFRRSYQVRVGEEAAKILFHKEKIFRLDSPGTFPKEYFESSMAGRVCFLRSQLSLWDLSTLRSWTPGVFKHPDVSLPRNVEFFLALNLKYIYPQIFRYDLPLSAYDDVVRRVRLWYKHRNDKKSQWKRIVSLKNDSIPVEPGPASYKIEEALSKGRATLGGILEEVVPSQRSNAPYREQWTVPGLCVTRRHLRNFMLLNQYMAFITDKNLGIAVVPLSWYKGKVDSILRTGYTEVDKVPTRLLKEGLFRIQTKRYWMSPQVASFLGQVPDFQHIPIFHGIPKVHKEPWKVRPIVPMHSFCTGNLSKVVHVLLEPFLKDFPTICQSSREFVYKLNCFTRNMDHSKVWNLFTIDVVSMYTNILTQHLLPSIRWTLDTYSDYTEGTIEWVLHAVELINENVFFQHDGKFYHQDQGIAMGTATGPVLANLFMGFYEQILDVQRMGFYIRYIDDIFVLSQWKLEDIQMALRIPGIDFTFEAGSELSFLDVLVHKHGEEVCYKPYAKKLNHYQYLPWVSSHPLSVKKGLVKTELTRMATLSKKQCYFEERKTFLCRMLALRGYPANVLDAWKQQVDWREPGSFSYERRERNRSFFLAASEYNPVWDQVRLQPVWDVVLDTLGRMGVDSVSQSIPKVLVKSLTRTWNLWDEVRKVNKRITTQPSMVLASTLEDQEFALPFRLSCDEQ